MLFPPHHERVRRGGEERPRRRPDEELFERQNIGPRKDLTSICSPGSALSRPSEPVATPGEFASASAISRPMRRIVLRSTPVTRSISHWLDPLSTTHPRESGSRSTGVAGTGYVRQPGLDRLSPATARVLLRPPPHARGQRDSWCPMHRTQQSAKARQSRRNRYRFAPTRMVRMRRVAAHR